MATARPVRSSPAYAPSVREPLSQAALRTRRIRLTPLADEHLQYEVQLDSDPEVMRYLGHGRARTREEVARLHRQRLAVADRVPGLGFWAGFVGKAFVGWWILEPPERADHEPVGPGRTRVPAPSTPLAQGPGQRSSPRELLRHGFETSASTASSPELLAINTASRATMASIGMKHARTFHTQSDEPPPGSDLARSSTRSRGGSGLPARAAWARRVAPHLRCGMRPVRHPSPETTQHPRPRRGEGADGWRAACRNRTDDLLITSQMLYRLS